MYAGINVEIGSFELTLKFLLEIEASSQGCILLQQVSKLFSQCLAIHLSSVICISEGASIDYYSSHSHQEESMNRFRMEAEVTQENC